MTQWFFGPALIDRGFRLTGGACELVRDAEAGYVELSDTKQFVTGMACKAVGGKWKGGHDISGHVFLLVLGSMFLMEELVHVLLKSAKAREERTIMMRDGAVKSADSETLVGADITSETAAQWDFGVKFVLGVVGLSMWMLLMTAVYFHTWFEKVSLLPLLAGDASKSKAVYWFAGGIRRHLRGSLPTPSRSEYESSAGNARCIVSSLEGELVVGGLMRDEAM